MLRQNAAPREFQAAGFAFAMVYAAAAAVAAFTLFPGDLLPRLHDVFLVGIVLTVYRFTWRPGTVLLAAGLIILAFVNSSLTGMASFALLACVLMAVMARLQTGY